jgi:hypothetical protein
MQQIQYMQRLGTGCISAAQRATHQPDHFKSSNPLLTINKIHKMEIVTFNYLF